MLVRLVCLHVISMYLKITKKIIITNLKIYDSINIKTILIYLQGMFWQGNGGKFV